MIGMIIKAYDFHVWFFLSVLFSSFPFIKHLGCVMMRFLGTIWCVAGVLCRMLAFS